MKSITLLIFFLLLGSTLTFGQNTPAGASGIDTKNWKTFKGSGFSIQYPDTFDLDESELMGTSFILFSKQVKDDDLFKENINLIIRDFSGQDIDFNDYVKDSENQIETLITDGKLLSSKRLTDSFGKECHRVIFTGKQGQLELKWIQYYWLLNGKSYSLTLTCEESQFDTYVKDGEAIMKTFKLK